MNEMDIQIGDNVLVCGDLVTVIEKKEPQLNGTYKYWFNDENGHLKYEYIDAITPYKGNKKIGSLIKGL